MAAPIVRSAFVGFGSMTPFDQPSRREIDGRALRKEVPRSSHGEWSPASDRPDPVDVITSQNDARVQYLVPIRHWRMSQSAFAFYRGGARLMAEDLSRTNSTGIRAQICGDAHLSNFGVYGSPERELVFDLNDFDETLPGPWEWDVKRLAASFAIAARYLGHGSHQADLAGSAAAGYRTAIRRFARMRYLDAWYATFRFEDVVETFSDQLSKKDRKRGRRFVEKARRKDSLHAHQRLAEEVDGEYRIASQPPLLVPLRDLPDVAHPDEIRPVVQESWDDYLESLPDHMKVLLRRFLLIDLALKVVGVGSVGTRCFVVLLEGRDEDDPFFLQIKEANRSVLEDHLPQSTYSNQGERVVAGQRLMQAASDSFLGWTLSSTTGSHYYWRQLKDMKASLDIENASPESIQRYAHLTGWALARAHARSADSAAIASYLGKGDVFDRAIGAFAVAYAHQNEEDYALFKRAIELGAIDAHE